MTTGIEQFETGKFFQCVTHGTTHVNLSILRKYRVAQFQVNFTQQIQLLTLLLAFNLQFFVFFAYSIVTLIFQYPLQLSRSFLRKGFTVSLELYNEDIDDSKITVKETLKT